MDKPLLPTPTLAAEPKTGQSAGCRPKKSTIAFLRQFARAYTVVPSISGPAAELIPN